ncbi:MAG: 3-isopropylmalate dehydratase large subunit [Bacillota bacterium]|nr:3-isopropylmalate dehydratase large subunit [Bacillota bacterium]HPZ53690.1 3-isopropylmalate dehydratase large subunit [Bacillota bacterium]HQD17949.1 3-isopropylmalate dehydratase large subunit [Bacillota bacterium]
MGMTLTEKILAKHAGRDRVRPGDFIVARVDLVLGNDITAPVAIAEFERIGATRVFDPDKIALVPDHFTPNKDIKSAEQVRIMREFAKKHGITHFFEIGEMGIEHCLLPEKGMVVPGDLVVGADSHTCTYGALGAFSTGVGSTDIAAAMATGELWFRVPETIRFVFRGSLKPWVGGKDLILYTIGKIGVDGARYKAMEFAGEAISSLSVEGRLTMANMAIEAGGKNGIFMPDQKTVEYLLERTDREYELLESDADAEYSEVYEFDASEIEPQVALPHLPENARPVSEVKGIQIDQVVIGSCTNGRIEDLREAAAILRNKKVARGVRCIIIPGTQSVYLQAVREGLVEVFVEAGAVVSTPTCGPCLGGHMGVLAAGERAVSTTNRNFVGRMGHPKSEVYLAGPAVAAASAVAGEIVGPEEVV